MRPAHHRSARLLAVAVLTLVLVACGKDKAAKVLSGYQLNPAPVVTSITLPEASNGGKDFAFQPAQGDFMLVYFGYTNCPDVCPTTLSDIKKALQKIGPTEAAKVDMAMITIDPKRDTGDVLTSYVRSFIPTAHALRTDDDKILRKAAKTFGAAYTVTTNSAGDEEVSHTGNVYIVDHTGTVVLEWPFGIQPPAMATDLQILFSRKA